MVQKCLVGMILGKIGKKKWKLREKMGESSV